MLNPLSLSTTPWKSEGLRTALRCPGAIGQKDHHWTLLVWLQRNRCRQSHYPPRTRPIVIGFQCNVRIISRPGEELRDNVELFVKKYYLEKHHDISDRVVFISSVDICVRKGQVEFIFHSRTETDGFANAFPHNIELKSGRRGR